MNFMIKFQKYYNFSLNCFSLSITINEYVDKKNIRIIIKLGTYETIENIIIFIISTLDINNLYYI